MGGFFMRKFYLLLAAAAVISMGWAAHSFAAGEESGVAIGGKAPDFTLADANGKNVNLHDFAGKIVVLEWTNPNCPFVQRVYREKEMVTTFDNFKGKGVNWVAINSTSSETNKENQDWATAQAIQFPILNDASGSVAKSYHATNTPEMFVIGADGKLLYKGAIDNDPSGDKGSGEKVNYVQQALSEISAGRPVSVPETAPYGCSVKYRD
jgi:peroxiredoxin